MGLFFVILYGLENGPTYLFITPKDIRLNDYGSPHQKVRELDRREKLAKLYFFFIFSPTLFHLYNKIKCFFFFRLCTRSHVKL